MILVATAAPAPDERPDFVVRFEGDEVNWDASLQTIEGFFTPPSFRITQESDEE